MHISGLQKTTARGHRHMHGQNWQTDLDWNRGLNWLHFTIFPFRSRHNTEDCSTDISSKNVYSLLFSGIFIYINPYCLAFLFLSLYIKSLNLAKSLLTLLK